MTPAARAGADMCLRAGPFGGAGGWAALARLHAAAFTTPRPWSAGEIEALAAMPGAVLIRALPGGAPRPPAHPADTLVQADPAGFVLGRLVADEAELLTLAVHPDARRQGLGRGLVVALAQALADRGGRRLLLEVAADNGAAIALYDRLGFARIGRRPGYYLAAGGGRCDALLMAQMLAVPADVATAAPVDVSDQRP